MDLLVVYLLVILVIDYRSQLTQGRKVLVTLEMISKLVNRVNFLSYELPTHACFYSYVTRFLILDIEKVESHIKARINERNIYRFL